MIQIPKPIYQKMINHAEREFPIECCGILSGKERIVQRIFELKNAEASDTRYSIFPQDQWKVFNGIEKEHMKMIAVYHSHPNTPPFPSETDVKLAFYPDVSSIIISLEDKKFPEIKAFRIREGEICPEEIEIIP
jgi:proteasome lid subunit RPN8/RPN11